jgi:quercetin dioxygenase-like cupin family protein
MPRLMLVAGFALMLAATAVWTGRAQQPAGRGAGALFTGETTVMESKDLTIARRRFAPGARTYWHSHDRGQLLFVEEGRMRVQNRGEAMRELGVGGTDYAGPNVVHWHGAAPDRPLVQINGGFGGMTKWLDAVTDAEYNGQKR